MKRALYTTLLCSALLTACGGGGGSADDQAPPSAIDSSSNLVTNSSSSVVTNPTSSDVTDPTSGGVTGGAANTAPVASAGADLGVLVGSLATLDGSGSNDADGDTLTYSWSLVSSPAGSSASLSGANAVNPSFTPDVAGAYVVSLTVNDGTVAGAADNVTVNAAIGNAAPVANAGADQNVLVGATVTLDGSASSDANSDTLSYTWVFHSRPNGSSASLSGADTVNPTFTADIAGDYVVNLTVNDGAVDSASDSVTVNAAVGNAAPVANAGANQNVNVGASVTLGGSGSSDADGDTLTYAWVFVSAPANSSASLSDANAVNPSFTADLEGEYVLSLTVNDGKASSTPDNVTINATVGNAAPVANAGADQNVNVGASVTLGGSASSDADGDTLTYAWVFVSAPANSSASLSDANAVNPSFTADLEGEYVLSLTVNDGKASSTPDNVTIKATVASTAPTDFGDAPPLQPPPDSGLPKVQADTLCEGYRVKGPLAIPGRLEVPAGQSCVLENGVTVDNVTLGAGATFYAQGVTVTNVDGNDGAARVVIENSVISNVELEFGVEITLRNNTISGAIRASNNTGLVYVADNVVNGQTDLLTNTGGVTVIGNTVGGNLTCSENVPEPTGSANVVGGDNVGQCAGL